jgi:hypothetical protein
LELVRFKKGQRKDDVLQQRLRRFKKDEGVVLVGVAQEKVRVPRTTRQQLEGGGTIPWIIYSTAMVNVYYFYCRDKDFGPFFLKFCSYFPYSAKLCLNGHEYLKCQLARRGIAFEAMDNGLFSGADIKAAQRISDALSEAKIEAFFRKGLARLPDPYSAQDRRAGYRYDLSVLQAEFSLTQVLGSPRPRALLLPGSHPRKHRFGPSRSGAGDLCPPDAKKDRHRRPMPDAHYHRGRGALPARLL